MMAHRTTKRKAYDFSSVVESAKPEERPDVKAYTKMSEESSSPTAAVAAVEEGDAPTFDGASDTSLMQLEKVAPESLSEGTAGGSASASTVASPDVLSTGDSTTDESSLSTGAREVKASSNTDPPTVENETMTDPASSDKASANAPSERDQPVPMEQDMDVEDEQSTEAQQQQQLLQLQQHQLQQQQLIQQQNMMVQARKINPVYELVIAQLCRDGLPEEGARLYQLATGNEKMLSPLNHEIDPRYLQNLRLDELVGTAIEMHESSALEGGEEEDADQDEADSDAEEQEMDTAQEAATEQDEEMEYYLDLQIDSKKAERRQYQTRFVTTHKGGVTCCSFSRCGRFAGTGSADASIKLLDVRKMRDNAVSSRKKGPTFSQKPVFSTLYDHAEPVTDLDFHPSSPVLASCSLDRTIKFFDLSVRSKRSFRMIADTHKVHSIHFHPRGDFVLAGTEHSMIRTYDVHSMQAFTSTRPIDHHHGPVNQVSIGLWCFLMRDQTTELKQPWQVRYSPDGRMFASASLDGSIRIWDAITARCEKYIPNAHSNRDVYSVTWSKSGAYLLSSGSDSTVRLWDIGQGKQVRRYIGASHPRTFSNVCFDHREDFVFGVDEGKLCIVMWDARTGEVVQRLSGHSNVISRIAASPSEAAFISASEDQRARFWFGKPIPTKPK